MGGRFTGHHTQQGKILEGEGKLLLKVCGLKRAEMGGGKYKRRKSAGLQLRCVK